MKDAVKDLAHYHADLNRQVLALGAQIRTIQLSADHSGSLRVQLRELRESLFEHFAREEEALFPFVAEALPDLGDQVDSMAVAHDTICGSIARMVHLTNTDAPLTLLTALFERFENTYAAHARTEAELLERLGSRLDATQRASLAALVEGL